MVKVQFFLRFQKMAGEKEFFIEAKNLKELLKKIVKKYPQLEDEIFEAMIFVNGNLLLGEERKKLDRPLGDGHTVGLFPLVAGG